MSAGIVYLVFTAFKKKKDAEKMQAVVKKALGYTFDIKKMSIGTYAINITEAKSD